MSAKTVGELRKVAAWPENLAITTPNREEKKPKGRQEYKKTPQSRIHRKLREDKVAKGQLRNKPLNDDPSIVELIELIQVEQFKAVVLRRSASGHSRQARG